MIIDKNMDYKDFIDQLGREIKDASIANIGVVFKKQIKSLEKVTPLMQDIHNDIKKFFVYVQSEYDEYLFNKNFSIVEFRKKLEANSVKRQKEMFKRIEDKIKYKLERGEIKDLNDKKAISEVIAKEFYNQYKQTYLDTLNELSKHVKYKDENINLDVVKKNMNKISPLLSRHIEKNYLMNESIIEYIDNHILTESDDNVKNENISKIAFVFTILGILSLVVVSGFITYYLLKLLLKDVTISGKKEFENISLKKFMFYFPSEHKKVVRLIIKGDNNLIRRIFAGIIECLYLVQFVVLAKVLISAVVDLFRK